LERHNRVNVATTVKDTAANYGYTTTSWRQANNSTGNQVKYTVGLSEDAVSASYNNIQAGSSAGVGIGIGVDSTSAASGGAGASASNSASTFFTMWGQYAGLPGVGQHTIAALEYGAASATFNSNSAPYNVYGLQVQLRM
jgi:hypothetical protein